MRRILRCLGDDLGGQTLPVVLVSQNPLENIRAESHLEPSLSGTRNCSVTTSSRSSTPSTRRLTQRCTRRDRTLWYFSQTRSSLRAMSASIVTVNLAFLVVIVSSYYHVPGVTRLSDTPRSLRGSSSSPVSWTRTTRESMMVIGLLQQFHA